MTHHRDRASEMLSDYANIRTIPAILTVAFVVASLYQFGGISTVELTWIGGAEGYTLTDQHAILVSLGSFAVAFASSETRRFEDYEDWEQVAIVIGPAVIIGAQYVSQINDILVGLGEPFGFQLAFIASIVSWGVAVR